MFENRVLRTILGTVWDPVTGQPGLGSNRDIRNLAGQPLITSVIRSRRLQWAGHVVRASKERDLQGPIRASDGETAPGQAKIAVGRQCSSGRNITGGQGLVSARDRGQQEGCDRGGDRASDPVVPTE